MSMPTAYPGIPSLPHISRIGYLPLFEGFDRLQVRQVRQNSPTSLAIFIQKKFFRKDCNVPALPKWCCECTRLIISPLICLSTTRGPESTIGSLRLAGVPVLA